MPVPVSPGETVTIDVRVTISESGVTFTGAQMSRSATELSRGGLPLISGRGAPPRPTYPGAISGRVVDADGHPVEGAVVLSLRRGTTGALLPFHEQGVTDPDGRFRLINRSPGEYFVVAIPWGLDLGAQVVSIRRGPAAIAGDDGVKRGHVATFHGGVTAVDLAPPVVVAASERPGIDIKLVRQPVFDLIGVIEAAPAARVGPAGFAIPRRSVSVTPYGGEAFGVALSRRVPLGEDNTFVANDLPAGEYRIEWSESGQYVDQYAAVGRSAVTTVRLTPRAGVEVTGRAEFRGTTAAPALVKDLSRLGVEVRPAVTTAGATFLRAPFKADGTFSVQAVGAGPFRVTATAPAPWVQIEGLVNGVDSLDLPVQAGSGFKDVVVVFADRPAVLSIEVVDAEDKPVKDARVLLFAEDTRYWGGRSRRVQIGQPGDTGVWTPSNLPPAKYLVVASREITTGTPVSAALVGSFLTRAKPVDLALGETKTIRVRVE